MSKNLKIKSKINIIKIMIWVVLVLIIINLLAMSCIMFLLILDQRHIDITRYQENIDYGILSQQQIETFNEILDAINNEQYVISCPVYSTKEQHEISTQIGLHFGNMESVWGLINWEYNSAILNLDLFKELSDDKIIIDARIDEAVSTLYEGSDRYKLRQISKYIANKIVYTDEYRGTIDALNGKGVCSSYTMLFYKMATRLGINTYTCYGYTSDMYHTWNVVELNGEYFYYDITFYDRVIKDAMYIYRKNSHIENFQVNNIWSVDLYKLKARSSKIIQRKINKLSENQMEFASQECLVPDIDHMLYGLTTRSAMLADEYARVLYIDDYVED